MEKQTNLFNSLKSLFSENAPFTSCSEINFSPIHTDVSLILRMNYIYKKIQSLERLC
jgi:hypothetical protein